MLRRTTTPKIAAIRLVEHVERASLDGMAVVLDGDPEQRFSSTQWLATLGILVDLGRLQGLTPKAMLEATKYEPRVVRTPGGETAYSVKDLGWKAQAVAAMLRANDHGHGAILL